MRTFLIGGGRDPEGVAASHAAFAAAVDGEVALLVLDEGEDTDVERWTGNLRAAGVQARAVVVSPDRPPVADDVADAAGVYVAGGLTPGYQEVLVGAGTAWLDAVRGRGVPYAGFSAGAAVAAGRALVGGWRAELRGAVVPVVDEGAGEDLDRIELREGLGLVPFHVDVHAAQWGTLTRLVHALGAGEATAGAAVDEHAALEVDDGALRVHGHGAVYWLTRTPSGLEVRVLVAGDEARLADLL